MQSTNHGNLRNSSLAETDQSTAIEMVTEGTQTGQCACDIRNPQGDCCLGNVHAAVKRARLALEAVPTGV